MCENRKFGAWGDPTLTAVELIERQRRALTNAIWVFACKGLCTKPSELFGHRSYPRVELLPPRELSGSCFDVELTLAWMVSQQLIEMNSSVRVHFGEETKIEQKSGVPLGGGAVLDPNGTRVGVLFSHETKVGNSVRRVVDWIIAPASGDDRAIVERGILHTAVLRIRLLPDAKLDPALKLPQAEPGKSTNQLVYQLAKTLKQGKTQARLELNNDEIQSSTIYE